MNMSPYLLSALLLIVFISDKVNSDTNYRLNSLVKPSSYAISITPYFETGDAREFTFDGEVVIKSTPDQDVSQIKMHSEKLNFTASDITISGGVQLNLSNPLEFDNKYTFVHINLATILRAGEEYNITIKYVGEIRKELNGFYRNWYMENGVKKWLGTTQMEPTHARKVFPCFDEPEYKATFALTLDRPQSYKPSLSNMKLRETTILSNGYVRDVFYPTPRMSTYLLAFHISEFEPAENETASQNFGVYTRAGAKNQTAYTVEVGKRIVSALGEYFNIDYYSTDENIKLDHVAVIDFSAGAMENWGMVTYRESLLLYVPGESLPYYKYRVAQIMAHETTHMWFGDLVTCHWWSDTWLNEGFANYFQDYIMSVIEPEMGTINLLVTDSVYTAYAADEAENPEPITDDSVNSPEDISKHFGSISYQKAGSVIRMMHHLVGDQAFKYGLHIYLNTSRFGVGYPEDLFNGLHQGVTLTNSFSEYPGFTIADVMSSWITQAGHPVLTVNVNYENDTITLTQHRFYGNSSHNSSEIYKIPITYATNAQEFNNTKPGFIMDKEKHEFVVPNIGQNHSWVIFNVQESGLYRVNYDEHSWKIISDALKGEERLHIHELNRAKIVNDIFAFFFADVVKFELLNDVLEFLRNETAYSVWNAALGGFKKLRNAYLGTDASKHIETMALSLMENIVENLGYEERPSDDFVTLRNRQQLLDFACKIDHTGCIKHMGELFKTLKENGTEISPSLRPAAYCTGLRFGDEDDYDFMWHRMSTTNVMNEARTISELLGCTTVKEKLESYLVSMLDENSPILSQDVTTPLSSVLSNYSNVNIVINAMNLNYSLWQSIYTSMDTVFTKIAGSLHTDQEIKEFDNWLSSCSQCNQDSISSARRSLSHTSSSVSWAHEHKPDIMSVLENNAITSRPSTVILLVSSILFFFVTL